MASRHASRWARTALASVSLTALVAATGGRAEAAPVYSWTGFYVGGFVGAAWHNADATSSTDCPPRGWFCWSGFPASFPNASAVSAAGTGSITGTGFTGGGTAGFNAQFGGWLAGIETDFGSFSFHGTRAISSRYPASNGLVGGFAGSAFNVTTSVDQSWLYTLRGRVGYVFSPNLLVFATGGLAVSHVTMGYSFSDAFGATAAASDGATKTGFAVGGGAEWKFARNWSVKVDYLYVDLGSLSATASLPNTIAGNAGYSQSINTSVDLTAHIARFGVNYQF